MKNAAILLFLGLLAFSCTKDPLNPNANTSSTPATPNACPTADGALWAIKSVTTREVGFGIPPVSITIGLGVGFFSSNGLSGNPMTRASVGTVTLNGESADYQGETYVTIPDAQNASGISFGTGVTWEVTGDNGFGAFTHTLTSVFPSASEITSGNTVTKANGYTLTCNTVTGADSVLFLINDVSKTIAGNATSCIFSAAELSSLPTGANQLVQIVPYSTTSALVGGKNICFGKEMVQQLAVTIQ